MDPQPAQPVSAAARPLDYARPAEPRVRSSELWSYREPVLLRYPQVTWRIALLLVVLYASTPLFQNMGYDARMLHEMGLVVLWWAFVARLLIDVLVTIYRTAESVQDWLGRDVDSGPGQMSSRERV